MSNNTNNRPPVMRGPGGRGGHMMPGAKAQDFKGTIRKTIQFMRSSVPAILIAFLLAIGGVVLTLNIPKVLGNATDEIIVGLMKANVYDTVTHTRDAMETISGAIAALPAQELAPLMQDPDSTLQSLVDEGLLDASAFDGLDASLRSGIMQTPLSAMRQAAGAGQAEYKTVGDYINSMEGGDRIIENIPPQYRGALLETGLETRPGVDMGAVMRILLVLATLVVFSALLSYMQNFLMSGVSQKVSYRLRDQINRKMNKLPLSFYDKTTHGEVLSLITNDVDTVSTTLNQSLTQMITAVTTLVGVLVMMLSISGWMTLASLVALPFSFLVIRVVVKRSQKYFRSQQEYLGHVNGHIEEMYSGHNVVRLFNGEERSREKFQELNTHLYSSGWRSQFLSGLMHPVLNFVSNIGYVIVCVLGGFLTIRGSITIGNIQSFIQYVRRFNQPVTQSAQIMNTLQSTAAAAERVFNFLDAEEERDEGSHALTEKGVRGDVTFEHVDFGYTPEKTIIHDFSAHVKDGQRIAIVGPTGAGKTTIVKLLMHFYELNSGRILLDGTNIADLSRHDLRGQIGMVLQDTWLFNGTIRDNIRYGRLDATDEQVERAAQMACADHFIKTLPGGYDFELNEEASNVSHGQKQLLTIARAILADPAVLILDEATSSVDTRTEVLIQQAMNRLMQGRTSFIIAHRLSTIRDADRILVLNEGDVVEQGTHEELLAKGGFYANLYNSQFEPTDEAV